MPTCFVMVGLPASGKSTYMQFLEHPDYGDTFTYSTDNILERIANQLGKNYDDVFEKHIKSAKTEADIFLAEAIKNRVDIYWDQTNLGIKKRRGIIDKMKRANYDIVALVFKKPEALEDIEEWNRRLKSRKGKTIPDNVIYNMVKSYVEPTLDEGFSQICFFNIYGEMIDEIRNDE